MENERKLIVGAMVTLSLATAAMIVVPFMQLKDVPAPEALAPYTSEQLRGREVYIANACIACHTQQPSTTGAGIADASRGWGRASVAADYHYDSPPLLGTMRTGPDLFNIGARQPSADWHLGHLFQPRAYVPGSVMPAYRYMFEVKDPGSVAKGERVVSLPPGAVEEGKVVVAKPEALDLVAYLQGLDRTYTVLSAEEAEWAASRLAPSRLAKEPAEAVTDTNESGNTDETKTNP
ncbi:cbb3-type cytochrome c oxidase subunit II [Allopusillimonas ginsengisoli]|uniref:cbb3-type cytochrome c oxidase subunit II n=1 Tax=Alcaligenaceae TaxID=506 RepID=UPI001D0FA2C0|nr:cbb3-type cytochrome c oxidase subunit II [Pusillimonas sp. MFBS29]MCC2597760.1 cbb3-type cytochrome c oxidase subunit II [Pusillimonas sp. MFBS29]